MYKDILLCQDKRKRGDVSRSIRKHACVVPTGRFLSGRARAKKSCATQIIPFSPSPSHHSCCCFTIMLLNVDEIAAVELVVVAMIVKYPRQDGQAKPIQSLRHP